MTRESIIVTPEDVEACREFIDALEQDIRMDNPGFRFTDDDRIEVTREILWNEQEQNLEVLP